MALVKPFVTKKFIAYPGDSISTKVSLAVWIIDEVTGKRPTIDLTVELKGLRIKPIKNPSGYYCFTDLEAGDYTLVVQPDPVRSDWYFSVEVSVKILPEDEIEEEDRLNPVKEIMLKPKPSYPFTRQLTLIRGMVLETSGEKKIGIPDIPIYILDINNEKIIETTSNTVGEFVLYIKNFNIQPGTDSMKVTLEAQKENVTKQKEIIIPKEGITFIANVEFAASQ